MIQQRTGASYGLNQILAKFYRIQHHNYETGVQWNFKMPIEIPDTKTNDVVSILSGNNWDTGHKSC